MKNPQYLKILFLVLSGVLGLLAGIEFWELRHYKETVVVSEDFTEKVMLSQYLPSLKNTWGDTPIYVYDSGVPGGSMLVLGGTHPYEPATSLATYVMMENIDVTSGKVYIIPHANMSASTLGMLGNAYIKYYHIETTWGQKKFRVGDRNTNPLDQWPDPFTYVHYPSTQNLAYQDIRNLNRTFPGRPDGTLTERISYAIMELIRNEDIDIFFDFHEASLMYPVVSTYVAHDRSMDISMMAAMMLSATQFPMKSEASPKNLRGLTHREVGDFSNTLAILMETPEAFIDRVVGRMSEELMLEGKDEFLQTAAEKGLVYCDYDIYEGFPDALGNMIIGTPMDYRVGRHLSGTLEALNWMNQFFPDKAISVTFPNYVDVMNNGSGHYLHDPSKADPSRVFQN
ncbi:MAG: succinylglutamate desuccinylase/aspartoacylase family protein [Kosmotogaceae bacterium]|nr:succinylglutamate desuccinylase/aspartoacylase family protein [Kosmotogaceae bacterium]